MNVLAASQILFDWFSKNDSFCFNRDFTKICTKSKNKDEEEGAIMLALRELQGGGIVKLYLSGGETSKNKEGMWVLRKPFEAYDQEISINGSTAMNIAQVINNFCEAVGDKTQDYDPKNISQKDICNLLQITSVLASKLQETESQSVIDKNNKK